MLVVCRAVCLVNRSTPAALELQGGEVGMRICQSHLPKRFGVRSLERTFEVSVVDEDATEELVCGHFLAIIGVSNTTDLKVSKAIGDVETWIQESVTVEVLE